MNHKTVIGILFIAFAVLYGISFLNKTENPIQDEVINTKDKKEETLQITDEEKMSESNPVAIVTTNKGQFEIELFIDQVPETAGNFKKLSEEGFYNGTKFHRIIDGFMIQGGDPLSKDDSKEAMWGTGDPGYKFDDEFAEGLSNVVGTISMANGGPNTNGSQFFINVKDNSFLDFDKEPLTSKHSVFGKVISGLDVVMNISQVETLPGDRPAEPVVIESVVIK